MQDYLKDALYARGFLISKSNLSDSLETVTKRSWNTFEFSKGCYVSVDTRVGYSLKRKGQKTVCVLGTSVDITNMTDDLNIVCEKLLSCLHKKNTFLDYVDELCGRFLIIYTNNKQRGGVNILQDATGMRSCFYGKEMVSSHYGLINEFEKNKGTPYWEKYNAYEKKPWYLPGNTTPFENIFSLIPNHELEFFTKKVCRIWPRKQKQSVNASEAADYFVETLKKQVQVLSKNHNFLLSVTGGRDSRVTLSAFSDVKKNNVLLFSYLNNSTTDTCAYDNKIAFYLSKQSGFDYKQLVLEKPSSKELRDVYFKNNYHEHVIRAIPLYCTELPVYETTLHIRSNVLEIIRHRDYFRFTKKVSGEELAKTTYGWYKLIDDYVLQCFEKFYSQQQYDQLLGYENEADDIFYWEYRMGLWHSGLLLGSDIAFNTYCLFNQRKLLELGLRMPKIFRNNNFLVYEAIRRLKPELMFKLPNENLDISSCYSEFFDGFFKNKTEHHFESNKKNIFTKDSLFFTEFGFLDETLCTGDYISLEYNQKISEKKKYYISFCANVITQSKIEKDASVFVEFYVNRKLSERKTLDLFIGRNYLFEQTSLPEADFLKVKIKLNIEQKITSVFIVNISNLIIQGV